MRSRLVGLVWALAAFCLTAAATTPLGYVTVSGSHLTDFSGNLISNATITWAPVSNAGVPIPARINGAGQGIIRPVTATVTGGAFTIMVADTMLTSPQNLCYAVTVTDKTTGDTLISTGYTCAQPAGSGVAVTGGSAWCTAATGSAGGSCNFDSFVPNVAGQAIVQAGPTGPTGPAGAGFIAGLSSDSNSGISVTGIVAAKNLAVSVLSFGAKCDGTTDDTSAFNAAWASINTAGGEIDLPSGTCYVPNGLKFNQTTPNSSTTRIIRGLGSWQSIILTHNANIGIELGGVVGIVLKDFTLHDNGTTAAVGIARYRPDWTLGYSGQCGSHIYDNVAINGNYSIANLYSIGCEVNTHRDLSMQNGGAGAVLAIAYNNCLGMSGMTMPINATGASDTVNHFFGGSMLYYGSSSTGAAVDFCNGSADDATFYGTYFFANSPAAMIQLGGAYTDQIQGSKSFHSVRFEGSGDAIAINASGVQGLTIDSGSTFGETTPGIDIHQVNTSWAGGASGLIQADIHGSGTLGRGMILGPVFSSVIQTYGPITILNNSYINSDTLTASSYSFPGNWVNIGTVLVQNDFNSGATGSMKMIFGPNSIYGSAGGSALVMTPFKGAPLTPVNGELAIADGASWQPSGVTSQTLVIYNSGSSTWVPVFGTGSYLPVASPTFTGTLTGPTVSATTSVFTPLVQSSSALTLTAAGNIAANVAGGSPTFGIAGASNDVYLALNNTQSGGSAWYLGSNATGSGYGAGNLCLGVGGGCTYKWNSAGAFQTTSLTTANSSIDSNGVRHKGGTAPTASAGTITGANEGGYITGLSAATSVTITFANSGWTTWASCQWTPYATGGAGYISSTAGLKTGSTFTFSAAYTGSVSYHCDGN